MNFPHSVSIVIPCPLSPTRSMANLFERAARLGQMIIGWPFVCIHGTPLFRHLLDKWLQRFPVTMVTYFQASLMALTTNDARYRGPIAFPSPMPLDLVGPPTRRIAGVGMFMSLFTRILVHLIGFDDRVEQWRGGKDAAQSTAGSRDASPGGENGQSPTLAPDGR